jgi:hypothetical protein
MILDLVRPVSGVAPGPRPGLPKRLPPCEAIRPLVLPLCHLPRVLLRLLPPGALGGPVAATRATSGSGAIQQFACHCLQGVQ